MFSVKYEHRYTFVLLPHRVFWRSRYLPERSLAEAICVVCQISAAGPSFVVVAESSAHIIKVAFLRHSGCLLVKHMYFNV